RKLERSDIEHLIPSFIQAFNLGEWQQSWTEDSARRCLEELFSYPNFYGLLAHQDGAYLGAILGHLHSFNDSRTYYIDELFVAPEFQRQGVAKALYNKTIEDLKKEGVAGSFFTTMRDSAAYEFYTEQGAIDLKDSAVFFHPYN
ncbi:MAG: GNAT family N-acetyltransferase, partial [Eubacteriales bacterium]|nr:GNAT family N-acetyltransferase [Eubacteriales bacterium]